jgi:neurotransmitter:Na+ symporter, NSS family|tara:strand:- start:766 stop:1269 length:504 start_codon:yes stop_codon:yes gene_type:complete
VIANSLVICLLDFLFSVLAGLVGWGAIGYLQIKGSTAALQTSSVGLGFIAFPEATSLDPEQNGKGWFTFLMFTLFIASIDSAFSYVESVVTNIIDEFHIGRIGASIFVCLMGAILSLFFTSNFGWVFLDLCDHYISSYVVLGAALMQCVAVGWVFERESTAKMSPAH